MNQPAGYSELLAGLVRDFEMLPDMPEETAESTLRALWAQVMGYSVSAQLALSTPLRELNAGEMQSLQVLIRRRQSGEPLAHITGRQHFCGLELLAGPAALVPRRETEILARAVLDRIRQTESPQPRIIDVCTGCGNLPLVYAQHFPQAMILAADLSEEAVALANRNRDFTGFTDNVQFSVGDLLAPFDTAELRETVDVISCNPPYISSKKVSVMAAPVVRYEPVMAFDGGPFGISILQRLVSEAPLLLRPGGWLVFEVGLGQGPALVKKLHRLPYYDAVETHSDDVGDIRVVAARKAQQGIKA